MEYTSVKIPKEMQESIIRLAFPLGYRSISEFIIESTRIRLIQIKRDGI